MPTSTLIAQYSTLILTAALFAAAFILGLRHMRRATPENPTTSMGNAARATVILATLIGAALLGWRAMSQKNISLPLTNHFDAFLVLGLLLALVLMYFRWTRHLRELSFFMLPMVAGMLLLGGVLEAISPEPYHYESVWTRIHIVTVITGTVCFALACVGSIVYLLAARRLKRKVGLVMGKPQAPKRRIGFPPLASMEKFNQWMVYLGFPLLTVAMITGARRLAQGALAENDYAALWQIAPKIAFAVMAWLIYAVLLHLPQSFRGPRAAWLSIFGFALFLGGYVAVIWMK